MKLQVRRELIRAVAITVVTLILLVLISRGCVG